MDHAHKVDVPLSHELDMGEAIQFLLLQLDCDSWYVACHQEHLFVCRLAKGSVDQYAVSLQCTPPVDKAIYHGSKTWALSIIPLHGVESLPEPKVNEIKTGLERLQDQTSGA
jgi:hypothetical protein